MCEEMNGRCECHVGIYAYIYMGSEEESLTFLINEMNGGNVSGMGL